MSSILKALKKAEKESGGDRHTAPQRVLPLPEPSPYRQRRRHLRLLAGMSIALLCVCAALFWQLRRMDHPWLALLGQPSEEQGAVRHRIPGPSTAPVATSPSTAPTIRTDSAGGEKRSSAQTPVGPASRPAPPEPRPEAARPVFGPEPDSLSLPPVTESPVTRPAPPPAPEQPPQQRPPAPAEPVEARKSYRNDSRIDLQALVWSDDPEARFVLINDRLIKEGGSIEGITVVQINAEDILVAEGGERWYEPFQIR